MLFNSFPFLFVFLPVCLIGYFGLGAFIGLRAAIMWLSVASIFFYAYWDVRYLGLLATSMGFNYLIGICLAQKPTKALLTFGVVLNLALLGYYKYANFFVDNLNRLAGADWHLATIILPLGISFFTFTQIAFLVDAARGLAKERSLLSYVLFVTFFPHLIAGPILHHKEMMSQFVDKRIAELNWRNFAVGWTVFAMGLFKKVIFADQVAVYARQVFEPGVGVVPTFFDAWIGALAYTLQLYFDFSGYSDMAVGLALMFNIRLPINFYSPYQAKNIIVFWRRWHMTLSRYLRDYLYISLGGNRRGSLRRYLNLFLTMLLGGLWHGAGWTFVVWGALHGLYLMINHGWQSVSRQLPAAPLPSWIKSGSAQTATFLAVVVGWVFFRASDMSAALTILKGMAGLNGLSLPGELRAYLGQLAPLGVSFDGLVPAMVNLSTKEIVFKISLLLAVVFMLPNVTMMLSRFESFLGVVETSRVRWFSWRPSTVWGVITGVIAAIAICSLNQVSEFLYFQF
jgi:Predicted membrane protein involved in D-alanine export